MLFTRWVVRPMMLTKMDTWCEMSSDANPTPKMIPRYLARSPVSILSAIQIMAGSGLRFSGRRARLDRLAESAQREVGDVVGHDVGAQSLHQLAAEQGLADRPILPVVQALPDNAEADEHAPLEWKVGEQLVEDGQEHVHHRPDVLANNFFRGWRRGGPGHLPAHQCHGGFLRHFEHAGDHGAD